MSTPEVLLIDQTSLIHCIAAAKKERQLLNQLAQRKTPLSRRLLKRRDADIHC